MIYGTGETTSLTKGGSHNDHNHLTGLIEFSHQPSKIRNKIKLDRSKNGIAGFLVSQGFVTIYHLTLPMPSTPLYSPRTKGTRLPQNKQASQGKSGIHLYLVFENVDEKMLKSGNIF